jgi:AraC-like DNA-binding protein
MNSIRIPRSALGAPTASWRRLVCESADLLDHLRNTAPAREFVESVRQALRSLCAGARIDLESFAAAARMRPRTLQRRLGESGETFSGIVQEVQLARAIEMMSRADVKLIDVSLELGFSDPAHFTRAFRRWTGHAPREFRGALDGRAHLESSRARVRPDAGLRRRPAS